MAPLNYLETHYVMNYERKIMLKLPNKNSMLIYSLIPSNQIARQFYVLQE